MGDPNEIAGRRYDLARVARSRGDYGQAARLYEETLSFVRNELKNKDATAGTLVDLGEVAWNQGNLELATRQFEESLAIGREIRAQRIIAAASNGLGKVACSRGDYEKANALHKEALTILKKIGNAWYVAYTLESFATLAVAQRNMERAVRLFGATETFYIQFRYLVSSLDRENHERDLALVRGSLSQDEFDRLWAEGKAMMFDQMIQYALEG
jgi:tetratricopeptide (TPR) repeat protein